jgi:DNA-binding Lrp family transcriptional regulator
MQIAFVLLNIETGSEAEVLEILKKVEGVDDVFAVYGVYDIIARIRAASMDKLKEIITRHIRRIDKVRSTLTMLVIGELK